MNECTQIKQEYIKTPADSLKKLGNQSNLEHMTFSSGGGPAIQCVKPTDNPAHRQEAEAAEKALTDILTGINLAEMKAGTETLDKGYELMDFYEHLKYYIKALIDDNLIAQIQKISTEVIMLDAERLASHGKIGMGAALSKAEQLMDERGGGSQTLLGIRPQPLLKPNPSMGTDGSKEKPKVKSESQVKWEAANKRMFEQATDSGLKIAPDALRKFIEELATIIQKEGISFYRKNEIGEDFLPMDKIETAFQQFCIDLSESMVKISAGEENPIVVASRIWDDFTRIHPFSDGNGRVRSLLIDYVLICSELPPFLPIMKPDDRTANKRIRMITSGIKRSMISK